MKRLLIGMIALTTVLSSCKKDSTSSSGSSTITASMDGSQVTFNVNAKATRLNPTGAYSIQIGGAQSSGNSNQLALVVTSSSPIAPGTYDGSGGSDNISGLNYIDSGGKIYMSDTGSGNVSTVTITAVDNTSISGTFSGDVYLFDGSGFSTTVKKTFTSGTFKVKF